MKFAAKSSGLSPVENASVAGVEAAGKKMSSTSVARSSTAHAPKCALNLFDSDSSMSVDETAPPEWPQKRSQNTSLSEDVPKSLAAQGIFECFLFLFSCFDNYD
jgi:hypothetical protein